MFIMKKFITRMIILSVLFIGLACNVFAASDKTQKNTFNADWWSSFNDECLKEYIFQAIANNYDIKKSKLVVKEYEQFAKASFGAELPTVAVGGGFTALTATNAPTTGLLPVDLPNFHGNDLYIPIMASYELDFLLKNRDKTKSVKRGVEASKYGLETAYLSVSSIVGAMYFNIIKLDKIISLQEEILSLKKETMRVMKLKYENGLASENEYITTQKSFENVNIAMNNYKKTRELLLNKFSTIVGIDLAEAQNIKRSDLAKINFTGKIPAQVSSAVISARPDVAMQEELLQKAAIDVRVAKKEFFPTINLTGSFGYNAANFPKYLNWQTALLSGGASFVQALFTGGRKIANLKIMKIRYEKMMNDYINSNIQAAQEVNDSFAQLTYDNNNLTANANKVRFEAKSLNIADVSLKQGVISNYDYLSKKELLLQNTKELCTSKSQMFIDYIGFYKATGGKI